MFGSDDNPRASGGDHIRVRRGLWVPIPRMGARLVLYGKRTGDNVIKCLALSIQRLLKISPPGFYHGRCQLLSVSEQRKGI